MLFIYLFIYIFVCLFCPLLSEIPRNNQFEWIAAEAGKGEFVSVKHRQPKPMPSHTVTLPRGEICRRNDETSRYPPG